MYIACYAVEFLIKFNIFKSTIYRCYLRIILGQIAFANGFIKRLAMTKENSLWKGLNVIQFLEYTIRQGLIYENEFPKYQAS